MDELMKSIKDLEDKIETIVSLLPEELSDGLTCLSMAIDVYAFRHGFDSFKVWQHMNETSTEVYKEHGAYGE